jgi:hypothetical protein
MGYNEADVVRLARPWGKMPMANLPHPASKRKYKNLFLYKRNDVIGIFYE